MSARKNQSNFLKHCFLIGQLTWLSLKHWNYEKKCSKIQENILLHFQTTLLIMDYSNLANFKVQTSNRNRALLNKLYSWDRYAPLDP
jgi:hypothetical protein